MYKSLLNVPLVDRKTDDLPVRHRKQNEHRPEQPVVHKVIHANIVNFEVVEEEVQTRSKAKEEN